jgi:hypothetical protein
MAEPTQTVTREARTPWRVFFPCLLAVCGLLLTAVTGMAQQDRQPAPQPPGDILSWSPAGLAAIASEASSKTEFTFDRDMLALASNLTTLDPQARAAVARLNGVAVHLYRFQQPRSYDPGAVEAIRAQLQSMGWKHLVSQQDQPADSRNGRRNEAVLEPGRTDVWLDMHGTSPAGAAILLAGPSNVSFIVVSGDIDTLSLLHLRGHFGIPRFPDGNWSR